jgi:hypothetical protein
MGIALKQNIKHMKIEMTPQVWAKFLAYNFGLGYRSGKALGIITHNQIGAWHFLPIGSIQILKHPLATLGCEELAEIGKEIGLVNLQVDRIDPSGIYMSDDSYRVSVQFDGTVEVIKEVGVHYTTLWNDAVRIRELLHQKSYAFDWMGWSVQDQLDAGLIIWED